MTQNITVCGGGNGAHAMAGDLTLKGYNVTLFEHPQFKQNIQTILETKTIEVVGEIEGTATLDGTTVKAAEAAKDADVFMFPIPTYAQEPFFHLLLPHFQEGQTVIMTTGNYGSLKLGNLIKKAKGPQMLVGETSTLPYIARMVSPGKVNVIKDRKSLPSAAFPARRNDELIHHLDQLYPDAANLKKDIFETALNNMNPVAHPCGVLLNAGSIESAEMNNQDYYMYREGVSPSVAKVIEEVDRERLEIVQALEYSAKSLAGENTVYDILHSPKLLESVGPNSLTDRYLIEDVPYCLVPLSGLAGLVGKKIPVIDALITLASVLMGVDYIAEGRSLSNLGVSDLTIGQLKQFLFEGHQ